MVHDREPIGLARPLEGMDGAALRSGDLAAWERLFAVVESACLVCATRLLGDPHLAADAVQDGFLKAYRARATLRDDLDRRAWLVACVANAARDLSRQRGRRRWHPMGDTEPSLPAPPESDAREDALRLALADLDPDHAALLLLVHGEGIPYREAAERLGLTVGTVRSRLHRAREDLRERLLARQERP
jgi:RNA polymerase sigma-70 factor (ECF subfamily)